MYKHRKFRVFPCIKSTKGMTLLEILITSTIVGLIATYLTFVFIFSAKSQSILVPQMGRQTAGARAIQVMSDILRNANSDEITIVSQNEIQFQSSEGPNPDTIYKRIKFQGGEGSSPK